MSVVANVSGALNGKVIALTGAFGALGSATAAVLAERGAKLVLIDAAPAPAGAGPHLMLGGTDVRDAGAVGKALARATEKLGPLWGLVNIAGGFSMERVSAETVEVWDQMFAINLRTAVAASAAAIPLLRQAGAGRIVNVGANAALGPAGAAMGAYAAAKSGVHRLTESLAEELKDHHITVNAVLPTILDTPANRSAMPDADHGRWVTTTELAQVIAFLLSEESSAVTGALIPVKART